MTFNNIDEVLKYASQDVRELNTIPFSDDDDTAPNKYETAVEQAQKRRDETKSTITNSSVEITDDFVKITLAGERPYSWNKYWSGVHFSQRSSEKARVKELVQMTLFNAGYSRQPFNQRVSIQINVFMLHPVYDPDNAALKPYVDALEGFVIKNDNLKHVRAILPVVEKVKENPRVEILVGRLPWEKYIHV